MDIKVDLSRASVGDFMKVVTNSDSFLEFADKVVIGGISDLPLDQLPQITEAVLKQLNLLNIILKRQIELLQTMSSIEDFLDITDEGEDNEAT